MQFYPFSCHGKSSPRTTSERSQGEGETEIKPVVGKRREGDTLESTEKGNRWSWNR